MPEVTLQGVLEARDRRAARQRAMLAEYERPLVCFTMNIAGPVKTGEAIARAFAKGRRQLLDALGVNGIPVLAQEDLSGVAGYCLLLAADAEAGALKRICVGIEELSPAGRLYDMDVIGTDGTKLERGRERPCIVCGKPGRGCASRRIHPVEELQRVTQAILRDDRDADLADDAASFALQALADEVCCTPKPGLVDRANSGSHRDMDIFTFNAGIASLASYFRACCLTGARTKDLPEEEVFPSLKALGAEAEARMLRATGGVNTHKGAVFTLGILCAAAGRTEAKDEGEWLRACARLAARYRAPGVREEVADGLPSVRDRALPALRRAERAGLSFNDCCLYTLLCLLSCVRDTNMIARGGEEKAGDARARVRRLLDRAEGLLPPYEELRELDRDFIREGLSPGGCADLLAAALLVHRMLSRDGAETGYTTEDDCMEGTICSSSTTPEST